MIRVAHVTPTMTVGGMEQMILQLCRFHDPSRFESVVAAPNEGVIVADMRAEGIPVYTGPEARRQAAAGADLINLHWCGYSAGLVRWLEAVGKPWITTLHWRAVLPRLPAVTICTSRHTAEIQRHPDRCVTIGNGTDLTRFVRGEKATRDEIILTRVCRPPKCAPYFWDGVKRVLDRYPRTKLWIVGNPEGTGLSSDRIRFLGIRRDIPEILARTDIFVYTPYPEVGSHDLVVMEASAMGVPCVVSDVSPVRESVFDGENGFLTPFGSVSRFAARVGMLVEDSGLRTRMGQTAARLAREQFDMRAVARKYEAVYAAVLDSRRALARPRG